MQKKELKKRTLVARKAGKGAGTPEKAVGKKTVSGRVNKSRRSRRRSRPALLLGTGRFVGLMIFLNESVSFARQ